MSPQFKQKLRTLGYRSYAAYLRSEHWQRTRQRFANSKQIRRNESGFPICAACLKRARQLDLHHKTYDTLGAEHLRHLTLLCRTCHRAAHRKPMRRRPRQ